MQVETIEVGQKSTMELEIITLQQTVRQLMQQVGKLTQDNAELTAMITKIVSVYQDMHGELSRQREVLAQLPTGVSQPKRPRRSLSYEAWEQVNKMVSQTGNYAVIARELNLPASTVRKYAKMPMEEAEKLKVS